MYALLLLHIDPRRVPPPAGVERHRPVLVGRRQRSRARAASERRARRPRACRSQAGRCTRASAPPARRDRPGWRRARHGDARMQAVDPVQRARERACAAVDHHRHAVLDQEVAREQHALARQPDQQVARGMAAAGRDDERSSGHPGAACRCRVTGRSGVSRTRTRASHRAPRRGPSRRRARPPRLRSRARAVSGWAMTLAPARRKTMAPK